MGFGGNTWESLPITTAEVEAALPASVASSSPTGTRVRSVGIDPTAAPYNVDPEGKTDAWEGLATAWEDAQSAVFKGRVCPIILPPTAQILTSHSLPLFTGMSLVVPSADGRFQRRATITNLTTDLFTWPAGASGTVQDVYIDGLTFQGSGQLKATDFITRQPTDASGWYLFDSIFRHFGAYFFASAFSGAIQGPIFENFNISGCGAHVPMVAHLWSGEANYLVGNTVYWRGFVFKAAEPSKGVEPTVSGGVPSSSSAWIYQATPMCSTCWTGSDGVFVGRSFHGGNLLSQHPLYGSVPMFNVWFGMAATQGAPGSLYITGNPQMPLIVQGQVDRSELHWELDGHVEGRTVSAYNSAHNYALYEWAELEGRKFAALVGNLKGVEPPKAAESNANWAYIAQSEGASGSAAYINSTNPENGFTLKGNTNECCRAPFEQFTAPVVITDSSKVDVDIRFRNEPATFPLVKILQSAGSCDDISIRLKPLGTSQARVEIDETNSGVGKVSNIQWKDFRTGNTPMVNVRQRETIVPTNSAYTPSMSGSPAHIYLLKANVTSVTSSNAVEGQTYWFGFEQDQIGGHSFSWPSNVTWLGGQAAPWDGTPGARVIAKFEYKGGNFVELERSITTGKSKVLPYKPRAGSWKLPKGTIENAEYQTLAADRNVMRLTRYEGTGQVIKKAGVQVTLAAEGGTGLQVVIAAYADDGTGTAPQLQTPLKTWGLIVLGTTTGMKTLEEEWTEPEGPYWIGYALQWTTEPTKLPKIVSFKGELLPPTTTLNANFRNWTQTEVSGTPGKLTALAGDGTLRAGAALGV